MFYHWIIRIPHFQAHTYGRMMMLRGNFSGKAIIHPNGFFMEQAKDKNTFSRRCSLVGGFNPSEKYESQLG